jgi:ADP-ribose pyrophosphatase YjhB (NUDIX family)
MDFFEELAHKITAISSVARTGLAWSEELYERERYERILEIAAEMAALMASNNPEYEIEENLSRQLLQGWLGQVKPGVAGYVTPKVSTASFCFDAEGRMLLGKRGDSGLWFIPTGWLEVGLTPAENVVKEVLEETGIECRPLRLVAVRDTRRGLPGITATHPAILQNISVVFMCEALSSEFKLHPKETLEAGFYHEEEALNLVVERIAPLIKVGFAAWRGEVTSPYFD